MLKLCDPLFVVTDEQAERLNVLGHVAIGGPQVTQFVALPTAQHGNLDFEFADAVGIWKRSCVVTIVLFQRRTKSVEQLRYPIEHRT